MPKRPKTSPSKQFLDYSPDRENVFYYPHHEIQDKMLAIVWTVDKNLIFTSHDGSGLSLLGLKRGEVVGMHLSEFHGDTEVAKQSIDNHQRALKGESVTHVVKWKEIYFLSSIQPSHDNDGNIDGCLGISIDITARIEDERKLKESESIFRQLAETTNALILIYQDEYFIWANKTAEEISGYSLEELRTMKTIDLIHPDMREVVGKRIEERLAGSDTIPRYEIKILTKDNKVKWLDYSGARIKFGDRYAIMGTGLDITERKEAESALKESEKNYRSIVNTAHEGIWRIDKNANTDFANDHMAKMLGYTAEEMIGKSMYFFMDDDGIKLAKYNFQRRKEGISEEHEFRFVKKDGSDLWALLSTNPMTDGDGNFGGALAMVIDITDRKKNDKKLQEATSRLKIDQQALKDQNMALKKVLDHIELDKKEYQHNICEKLDMVILPIIEKLKEKVIPDNVAAVEILESNIKSILSRDMDIFKGLYEKLTPRELEICKQIRDGKSSKEISSRLNISVVTIHKHREKIRKKLGLTNQNLNLVAYLRLHDYSY